MIFQAARILKMYERFVVSWIVDPHYKNIMHCADLIRFDARESDCGMCGREAVNRMSFYIRIIQFI
jgi:hypothetical protein